MLHLKNAANTRLKKVAMSLKQNGEKFMEMFGMRKGKVEMF